MSVEITGGHPQKNKLELATVEAVCKDLGTTMNVEGDIFQVNGDKVLHFELRLDRYLRNGAVSVRVTDVNEVTRKRAAEIIAGKDDEGKEKCFIYDVKQKTLLLPSSLIEAKPKAGAKPKAKSGSVSSNGNASKSAAKTGDAGAKATEDASKGDADKGKK